MNELHLFAGRGGGILGGLLLGHRPVCAVEIEEHNRRGLLARQRDGILPRFPIWDDVQTFDGRPWKGRVDVVCGGFPCQDISSAGRGAGINGRKSSMWGHMARIVDEIRPRYVFAENSPNLVSRGLGRVLCDLASMGYDARWGVMGAETANLPHKRERIWIVADSQGFNGRDKPEDAGNGIAWRCREEFAEGSENDWVDVATEFCGVDDGMADRLDRLFAIGNGQVPAVAASAFHFLANVKDHASSEGASGADKINSELKEDSESERSEDCCASSCCASSDQSCAPNTVEVSNEQNQTLHVSVSEFDDMSQYLLKKNPKGMWLRLKYGSLDLLFRLYDEIRWRLDCLRFQTGRYNEFSESYLYVGKGKTWPERVKVKNERQK